MKKTRMQDPPKKNNVPVREKTYEYLKDKILSGGFIPGQRLAEEHLAEEFGVSRTPVREALHKLELEGLVKPLETRGFCVPQDSVEEMEEIFDLRAIMEGFALRVVCRDITEENIQCLNALIEEGEAAMHAGNTEKVFDANTNFHDMLYSLISESRPRLLSLMQDMRKYVLRYRKDTLQYQCETQRTIDGHKKIILALRLKDPDLCERLMREHVYEAKAGARQYIIESSEGNVGSDDFDR